MYQKLIYSHGFNFLGFCLWCLTPLSTNFSYIVVVTFISGEKGVPRENHRPAASHWQTLSHNVVSSTPRHEQDLNSQR